jgi:hypothetical protein
MHQLLLCIFCVLDRHYKTNFTIDKVFKVSTINVLHIYKLKYKLKDRKNDKSPSVKIYISDFVYILLICKKRMYTLYNTTHCVTTAWYINMGLHSVTIPIHMFPMSHKLTQSANISQKYNKANLTHMCGYLDVIIYIYEHALIFRLLTGSTISPEVVTEYDQE